MINRIRVRLRTVDRQAIYWAAFVIVVLVAGLIFILLTIHGSHYCSECGG